MATETTERDLVEEVEGLLAKATPGEWRNEGNVVADDNSIVVGTESYNWRFVAHVNSDTDEGGDTPPISEEEAAANTELICRARNYLLRRLVDENKALRAHVVDLNHDMEASNRHCEEYHYERPVE